MIVKSAHTSAQEIKVMTDDVERRLGICRTSWIVTR
jgi:hypothetical protein